VPSGGSADFDVRPGPPDRTVSAAASVQTVIHRGHSHSRSVTHTPKPSMIHEDGATTPGPFTDHFGGIFSGTSWNRGRDALAEIEEGTTSRARSVDRSLFESENKHAEPSVAMSNAVAPGHFEHSTTVNQHPSRSADASPINAGRDKPLPSPLFFQPYMVHAHQVQVQSASTPNFPHSVYAASNLDERPSTANKTPEGKSPPPRTFGSRSPESFKRAQEANDRRRHLEDDADKKHQELADSAVQRLDVHYEYPRSPSDDIFIPKQDEEAKRAPSYSSVNSTGMASATSPSDATSPISSANLSSQEKIFPSVPSLPALISGASSVSADPEGDFLTRPGIATVTMNSTPETLTPPSLSKHSTREETDVSPTTLGDDTILLSPDVDDEGYNGDGDPAGGDSDEDSDEGLTMTRRKPKKKEGVVVRRGTNASVGSTETAKKVGLAE